MPFARIRALCLKESALAGTAAKWRPPDRDKLARAGVGVCFCFSSPQCTKVGHQKVAVTRCDLLFFFFKKKKGDVTRAETALDKHQSRYFLAREY